MRRRGPQPDHRLPRGSTQRRGDLTPLGPPDHRVSARPGPARPGWLLLLASDGACEPHEGAGRDLAGYLTGTPHAAAERLVDDAVRRAHELHGPYADNATALVARITQDLSGRSSS
nr:MULTISPECIES: SpoIIE family protein phosphatase [Streptomyces]